MAIQFIEGFEEWNNTATLALATNIRRTGWLTNTGVSSFNVGTNFGRLRGSGLQVNSAGSATFIVRAIADNNYLVLGFALNVISSLADTVRIPLCAIGSTTSTLNGSASIYCGQFVSIGAASGAVFGTTSLAGTWRYIEVIWDKTNSICSVYVDGLLDAQRAITPGVFGAIFIGTYAVPTTPPNMYYDDVYFLDGTGSAPTNDRLGPRKVETYVPTASVVSDFTPSTGTNLSVVTRIPPSTAQSNVSDVPGAVDSYSYTNILSGLTPTAVNAVQVNAQALKSDVGSVPFSTLLDSNGTTVTQSQASGLLTTMAGFTQVVETDPDTAAAWTISGAQAITTGYRIDP